MAWIIPFALCCRRDIREEISKLRSRARLSTRLLCYLIRSNCKELSSIACNCTIWWQVTFIHISRSFAMEIMRPFEHSRAEGWWILFNFRGIGRIKNSALECENSLVNKKSTTKFANGCQATVLYDGKLWMTRALARASRFIHPRGITVSYFVVSFDWFSELVPESRIFRLSDCSNELSHPECR